MNKKTFLEQLLKVPTTDFLTHFHLFSGKHQFIAMTGVVSIILLLISIAQITFGEVSIKFNPKSLDFEESWTCIDVLYYANSKDSKDAAILFADYELCKIDYLGFMAKSYYKLIKVIFQDPKLG